MFYGKGKNIFRSVIRVLCFAAIFLPSKCNEVEDLPLCGVDNIDNISPAKNLLFVSTLDGHVTAIDSRDGTQLWQVPAGDSLLSSSIHRLELNNGGQWVRLVPSLSGSLYRFSGDSLEPLPLSAEQLLSASHKYSDDLVIAGGKETSSLGVSTKTGKIVYECSLNGCVNNTNWSEDSGTHIVDDPGEMVLIRRVTQTVRAIEPRSGQERWNFSVGLHELNLTPITRCVLPTSFVNFDKNDLVYKVVVPEGLICAMQKDAPHNVVWKKKLTSPIVGAWQYEAFQLKPLDLFGIAYAPTWGNEPPNNVFRDSLVSPSVYIGMHERQLYIQESVRMQALVQSQASSRLTIEHSQHKHSSSLIIPWRPFPAKQNPEWDSETALAVSDKEYSATALSVLYASEYVNGNGYFLFSNEERLGIEGPTCDKNNNILDVEKTDDSGEAEDHDEGGYVWSDDEPYNVLVVSLWYWWKEVAVIALSTAIFLNILSHRFKRKFLPPPERVHTKYVVYVDRHIPVPQPTTSIVPYQEPTPTPFVSRYLTDFEPLKCLGRGGFGIVFEAKNKIDDCSYAVKRITLPSRQKKREKVLREVKALAKLDHSHIVRYFNAWLEEPPLDWRDPFERVLKSEIELTETYSKVPPSLSNAKDSMKKNKPSNPGFHKNWGMGDSIMNDNNYTKSSNNHIMCNRKRSQSVNDSFSIVFEKDSHIDVSEDRISKLSNKSNGLRKDSFQEETCDSDDDYIVFAESDINEFDDKSECKEPKISDSIISISDSDFQIKSDKNDMSKNKDCVVIDESLICKRQNRGHRKNLSLDLQSVSRVTPEPMNQMYLYIQMQLCRTESLRDWLKQNTCPEIRKSQVVSIFEQIVHAVEYVHLQGLIHRDLKPSNIFFSFDGKIKVGDFGLVTAMIDPLGVDQPRSPIFGMSDVTNDKHTQHVGTHLYMSPEQLRGEAHGYKVDIWSLGLVLAELLIPFETEMERVRTLTDIRGHKFPKGFDQKYPQEHSLLSLMLSLEPERRPSTLGVRARAPLLHTTDPKFHFCLPPPLPKSHSSSSSSFSRSTSGSSS